MDWRCLAALLVLSTIASSCSSIVGSKASKKEFSDCEACPQMVKIPAGSYIRGDSIGEGRDNERPAISTPITKPFAVSKSPITVEQFRAFVTASGYKTMAELKPQEGCWGIREDLTIGWLPGQSWRGNSLDQEHSHPVVCVTWSDANRYAQWLSKTTGANYRLPSETEWEYAARAGQEGKYFYGDDPDKVCEYINHADKQMKMAWDADTGVSGCDDGFLHTSPVGHFPANNFGLHDAYGNVWEWVADCYSPQVVPTKTQPPKTQTCKEYTLRGASWASRPEGVTTSYRISGEAELRTVDFGFRVIREWVSK